MPVRTVNTGDEAAEALEGPPEGGHVVRSRHQAFVPPGDRGPEFGGLWSGPMRSGCRPAAAVPG